MQFHLSKLNLVYHAYVGTQQEYSFGKLRLH